MWTIIVIIVQKALDQETVWRHMWVLIIQHLLLEAAQLPIINLSYKDTKVSQLHQTSSSKITTVNLIYRYDKMTVLSFMFSWCLAFLEMVSYVMSQLEEGVDPNGKKMYTCKMCSFNNSKKEKVRQHVESWHGDAIGIRYKCDYCEKTYKCHSNMRTHVSTNHRQNFISLWT